jgi:hypothetical protein
MSLDRVDYTLQSGSKVEVEKSALPDGASTEAKQDTIIAELDDIQSNQTKTQYTRYGQDVEKVSDPEQAELLTGILNTLTKIELHLRHMTGVEYGGQDT